MSLTERQQRYILEKSGNMSAEKMARKLGIDKSEIEHFLKQPEEKSEASSSKINDSFIYWLLLLVVAVMPQLFHTDLMDQGVIRQMVMQVATGALWSVFLITRFLVNKPLSIPKRWGLLLAVLVPGWMALSLTWAVNSYQGLGQLSNVICGGALFALVCCLRPTLKQLRWGMFALFLSGVWTAVIGLAQFYDYNFLYALDIPQAFPPSATFGNKNVAAHFVIATMGLGVFSLCGARRIYELLLWPLVIVGAAVDYWFLSSASSAGAIAGLCVGIAGVALLLVLVWCSRYSRKLQLTIAGSVLAVCLLVASVVLAPVYSTANEQSHEFHEPFAPAFFRNLNLRISKFMPGFLHSDSLQIRARIYANTLCMIADYPLLGVGMGNHNVHYPLYYSKGMPDYEFGQNKQLAKVHNDLLQYTAETGITGFCLLMLLLVCWIGGVVRAIRQQETLADKLVILGAAFAVSIYLGISLISYPYQRVVPVIVTSFLAALVYSLSDESRREAAKSISIVAGKTLTIFAGLASVGLTVYGFYAADATYQKDKYSNLAIGYGNHNQWNELYAICPQVEEYAGKGKDSLMYCAMAYLFKNQTQKAAQLADRLVALYPNYVNGLGNAATIYESVEKLDLAIDVLDHATRVIPHDKEINGALFRMLHKQNKWEEQKGVVFSAEEISKVLAEIGQKKENTTKDMDPFLKHYFERDLFYQRQRIIFKLLIALDSFRLRNKREELNTLLEKGVQQNPDWQDLRAVYGMSLLNMGKPDEAFEQIAQVYRNVSNDLLNVNCVRMMLMSGGYLKDKQKSEKYMEQAGNYLSGFFRKHIYENLGGALSEINAIKGYLLISQLDEPITGINTEYLQFLQKPIELEKGSGLKITSDIKQVPLKANLYFLSSSLPLMKTFEPFLRERSGKKISVRPIARYNSKEIIEWPGIVIIAGKHDVRISLDKAVVDQLRKEGSALGLLAMNQNSYNVLSVLKGGKLVFEDAAGDKEIHFDLSKAAADVKKNLPPMALEADIIGNRAAAAIRINRKQFTWHSGAGVYYLDQSGKLVKSRIFTPNEYLQPRPTFDLCRVMYR